MQKRSLPRLISAVVALAACVAFASCRRPAKASPSPPLQPGRRGSILARGGEVLAADSSWTVEAQSVPESGGSQRYLRVHPLGETLAVLLGFSNGAGLEYTLDSVLRPTGAAQAGNAYLTLDLGLQRAVFEELKPAVEQTRAARGAALVLDPKTGEVLALADAPGYDPDQARLFPSEAWQSLAAGDEFEPVQLFALFPAAAVWSPSDSASSWSSSLESIQAFAAGLGRTKPGEVLSVLAAFGFGRPTGLELPAETRGELPDPAAIRADTARFDSLVAGKGVRVSLVQLAQAAGAIAADGKLAAPHLVARLATSANVARELGGSVRDALKAASASALRQSLAQGLPDQDRTAYCAGANAVQSEQGGAGPGRGVLVALGWYPAKTPGYVIAVMLDHPHPSQAQAQYACDLVQAIAGRLGSLPAAVAR